MTEPRVRLLPYGDRAVLVEVADLASVLAVYRGVRSQVHPAVIDIVPAARTVLVTFDPAGSTPESVGKWLVERATAGLDAAPDDAAEDPSRPVVEIPVRYDGVDLPDVALLTGRTVDDVVRSHARADYTVAFCGFAPGFGYLVGGDPALAVPRLATPRVRVPAGSVAIADEFTGIYPRESPGGWRLIGRTAVELWNLDRDPPALLTPGTRVRFVPVAAYDSDP